jgi:hypothetical protein
MAALMTEPNFGEVVRSIDQAVMSDVLRHRYIMMAIGLRYVDAGDGLTPGSIPALDQYMTMVTRAASGEHDLTSYADILALVTTID